MIAQGTKLSLSAAFYATLVSVTVMAAVLSVFIVLTDADFIASNTTEQLIGEAFGFAMLTTFFFGIPVSICVAIIARIYSATQLKYHDLGLLRLIIISVCLGLFASGFFAIVTSLVFLPLGVVGGIIAAFIFHKFQTGRWA